MDKRLTRQWAEFEEVESLRSIYVSTWVLMIPFGWFSLAYIYFLFSIFGDITINEKNPGTKNMKLSQAPMITYHRIIDMERQIMKFKCTYQRLGFLRPSR